jgi:hypothetical protein
VIVPNTIYFIFLQTPPFIFIFLYKQNIIIKEYKRFNFLQYKANTQVFLKQAKESIHQQEK